MRRFSTSTSAASEPAAITSEDGALSFIVRQCPDAVYVERVQPLSGIGQLSHIMRFPDVAAFDRAHETDTMRFKYPLLYWRLRRAVEQALQS